MIGRSTRSQEDIPGGGEYKELGHSTHTANAQKDTAARSSVHCRVKYGLYVFAARGVFVSAMEAIHSFKRGMDTHWYGNTAGCMVMERPCAIRFDNGPCTPRSTTFYEYRPTLLASSVWDH